MEQKVQDSLRKVDDEASKIQRDLERDYIRGIQGKALSNGAACCNNVAASAEEVRSCIQRTQQPVEQIQRIMRQEFDEFQKRMQRCMETCKDSAQVSLQRGGQREGVENDFGDCMCVCGEQSFNLLPLVRQRLVDQLGQFSKQ